jgi:DNA-binding MarR family transcriptional regulator
MGLSTALARTAFLVNTAYTEASRAYGFSPQQGQLLAILRPGAYGMSELVATLGLAKSSVTGMVDRLERTGLVRREPDPADSRAVRVALTPKGREAADGFYADGHERLERLAADLTAAQRESLARLLGRVVEGNRVSVIIP